MELTDGSLILNLVKAGFVGSSIVVMILGYKLSKQLVDSTSTDQEAMKLKSRTVSKYLWFSASLFTIGVATEIGSRLIPHSEEYPIKLIMHPLTLDNIPKEGMPFVKKDIRLEFTDGTAQTKVKFDDHVYIELEGIINLLRKYQQTDAARIGHSKEAGFDNAPL